MPETKHLTGYPSIDKPWMKYYAIGADKATAKPESMFQMMERCNKDRLDTVALDLRFSKDGYKKGITITYREYIRKIYTSASAISRMIQPQVDEIIPIIIPNLPESRIMIYALNILGVTVYPINPMLAPQMFDTILRENNVKTVAVFAGFWDKFAVAMNKPDIQNIIFLDGFESLPFAAKTIMRAKAHYPKDKRIIKYDVLIKQATAEKPKPYYREDHVAVVIGTSGTTGTSKGVCLTDRNLNELALGQEISDHYRTGEVALDILIQSIGYGISTAHSFSCIGCHTVLVPELVTDTFPELLCQVKPGCFPGGPVHYINLAHSLQFRTGQLPLVRCSFSGGATLEKDVERTLNSADIGFKEKPGDIIRVRQGYGSTECGGAATANTYGAYKFGTIGIPMANVLVSVFKPGTDEELKYGEEGEICVSGPTIMKGYLNNPEETNNVLKLHSDGKIWLHQADLGWCDEDGHFYMTDRIKNIFMRTGFNVHPSKISEFIISLPEVKDCVVVGVPHPTEQMVPVAFVVLQDSNADASVVKERLTKECKQGLSETDIPLDWFFVNELPRNMGGKVDTKKLVESCNVNYLKQEGKTKEGSYHS